MPECIDARRGPCHGEVLERYSLTGSGMTFPRCDTHWDDYVARTQPILDDIARKLGIVKLNGKKSTPI